MKKILLLTTFLVSACSVTPDYARPDVATPAAYREQVAAGEAVTKDWWQKFGSTELNTLMTKALVDNNDIRAAIARVEQARATVTATGATLLPTVDASGGASFNRTDPPSAKADTTRRASIGIDAAYELDLFGANRANVTAAKADERATEFDRDALALTVMGDVAQNYFNLVNTRERIASAEKNLGLVQQTLKIIQTRYDAGAISGLELAQQKTQVAGTQASLASLQQSETILLNALGVLTGEPPQNVNVAANSLTNLTVPSIDAGLPASLLERRPDIAAAEQALIAANADIGIARAAFFPSVNLSTGFDISKSPIGDPATTALSIAAALAQPIFHGGAIKAGVERASARQTELIENYRKTILIAFQEVEDALTAVKTAQIRNTQLTAAAQTSQAAYDIAQKRYDAGLVDFQTLLDAQGTLLNAEDAQTESRADLLNASVALYKALGGGWGA
ncbi:MAG TPA: efflux transporter outer membrane subunit [Alphaproteobacteria bacterium]